MNRIPFVAAVVGALLVGGATTGTTHARWMDQATTQSSSVTAGHMSFTRGEPGSLPALDKTATSVGTSEFTVTDTSSGKNLTQRITATVTGAPAGTTAHVGSDCTSATTTETYLDRTPGGNGTFCVKVTSSTGATSGNVTVELKGSQQPSGWSTPAPHPVVTIPVAINQGFELTCGGRVGLGNNEYRFNWTSVSGATGYTLARANSSAGPFTSNPNTVNSSTLTATVTQGSADQYYQVSAIGTGTVSTVIKLHRNSQTSFDCPAS